MRQKNIGMNDTRDVRPVMGMVRKIGKDVNHVNMVTTLNIILKIYIIIVD